MSHIPANVIWCCGKFGRCQICGAHHPSGWRRCPKCLRWCGAGCEPERCWSGDALSKCRDCPLPNDGVVEAASVKTSDHHEDLDVKAENETLCKICYDRKIDVILEPFCHSELCGRCTAKIDLCPFCRLPITNVIPVIKPWHWVFQRRPPLDCQGFRTLVEN